MRLATETRRLMTRLRRKKKVAALEEPAEIKERESVAGATSWGRGFDRTPPPHTPSDNAQWCHRFSSNNPRKTPATNHL